MGNLIWFLKIISKTASVGIAPVNPGGNSCSVGSAGISINKFAPMEEKDNWSSCMFMVNSPKGEPSKGMDAFCWGITISKTRSKLVKALSGHPSLSLSPSVLCNVYPRISNVLLISIPFFKTVSIFTESPPGVGKKFWKFIKKFISNGKELARLLITSLFSLKAAPSSLSIFL